MTTEGMRPRDNRAALVRTAVAGRVAPARLHPEVLAHDSEGGLVVLPGAGGISLGVHAGDPVDRWLADHLMVGLSIEDAEGTSATLGPLHLLACIGNTMRDSAGRAIGIVAGKRGGLAPGFLPPNLVSVEVADAQAQRLLPGDRVVVEALGRGLALPDWPDIGLCNLAPRLLDALPIVVGPKGLNVAVRAVLPSCRAGAGLGQDSWVGDVEVTADAAGPDVTDLCFGDLVALEAFDGRVSRFYRPGFLTVGVVAHGPSPVPGHGIGLTVLLSGPAAQISVHLDDAGSLGPLLRRWAAGLPAASATP